MKPFIVTCAFLVLPLLAPAAMAQGVHECTHDELSVVRGEQPGYWTASGEKPMVINGVHYANYAWAHHVIQGNRLDYVIAIRDVRRDGKPPYAYVWAETIHGSRVTGPWVHNTFGADSGRWACYHGMLSARESLHQGGYIGSVDNAPDVPEVPLE